ncbi:RNase adapter RapZ [Anaerococcus sp. AGMB00486]|uniref:RNase adapter RapZ n=2 Tax=Anaerococcus TaxID=165779 RepID=A0ABX2N8M7_9FIRM|nr:MULTISPECIES: RNase adapter RapZ [Anaerococcus]MDY3006175.1 RNase adapter RapZ [Anaerococcus porci]MSS77149.1 RNase adapter RapZ [Anaerococcus porci]NVF11047.1 RNase adapter RapZ [Anaerococcus faecalis]
MKVKIITGLSGSGKTTALRILEDLNYYAMDNVPGSLIESFIYLSKSQDKPIEKLACVVDFRSMEVEKNLKETLTNLKKINKDTSIIFLTSRDDVIIKRYNELRRPHPLGSFGDVKDGLEREKIMLSDIKDMADLIIDTSNYNNKNLKQVLLNISDRKESFIINLFSFGYKNGLSLDFDVVFDMRFLPNPYYIDDLKQLNGTDKKLRSYLDEFEIAQEFKNEVYKNLIKLIPYFAKEGKNSISIGFGCTGGQHRSVYMCESIYEKLKETNYIVIKKHRDKDKWRK